MLQLNQIHVFAALNGKSLIELEHMGVKRRFVKGAIVLNEGDRSDAFYAILSGRVKVFLNDAAGREVVLDVLSPGDHFGELALIDGTRRSASAMTLEESCVYVIPGDVFKLAMAQLPDLNAEIMKRLTERVRALSGNVKSLALDDVYSRIVRILHQLAEPDGECLCVRERLTQQELANRVGASREMVARIMKDLSRGGYISVSHRKIHIHRRLPKHY
ncbi:MAG: Crp/Fnr family transcriptional regulator [Pseudomonadota bacterium]|nr:Crp/Fnr family transcriptional regulator [Pseudomonadota bacterium]